MDQRLCRKPTTALKRTARYNLRKSYRTQNRPNAFRPAQQNAEINQERHEETVSEDSDEEPSDGEEDGGNEVDLPMRHNRHAQNDPVVIVEGEAEENPGPDSDSGDTDPDEHQNIMDIEAAPNDLNGDENQIDNQSEHSDHDPEEHENNADNVAVHHNFNGNQNPINNQSDDESQDDENLDSDEDSGSDEDDDNFQGRANRPLFAGAPITLAESLLLVLSLMLRHNLSSSCVADILMIIHLHCINNGLNRISLYKFNKYFSLGKKNLSTKHYYCSICLGSVQDQNGFCGVCNKRTKTPYFITMPFLKQLKQMMKRRNFYNLLQYRFDRNQRPGSIQDIYDGEIYKKFAQNHFLGDRNSISFTWYTDGVQVFKSSQKNMWPLYLCINELPYKERIKQENIILAGLWFGKGKPSANLFINKLRPEFEILNRGKNFDLPNGNSVRMRGVLLAGTADVPAKTQFLNLTLYSGDYGCCNCKIKGRTFLHPSGGHSHIFPYEENVEERTSGETVRQGMLAANPGPNTNIDDTKGVKGLCALRLIMPDFIGGMGIDVMHKVYGGVVKKLLFLWFDGSCRGEGYSLAHVQENINKRLRSQTPPKFCHRMPHSIDEMCHWKASELKLWFYYFSAPILCGLMLPIYFNHYLALILAISLLNGESCTDDKIDTAGILLHQFVRDFGTLYGDKNYTINVHGLLHLPQCVKRLGPLWVSSCFPFEDINGKLVKLVHGTSHLDSQVVSRHCQIVKLQGRFDELAEGPVRDFVINNKKRQVAINERIFAHCYSVGKYKSDQELPQRFAIALQHSNVRINSIKTYLRLLKDGQLYVCNSYRDHLKTLSSYAIYIRDGSQRVGCIEMFVKARSCQCENECQCPEEHYAILSDVNLSNSFDFVAGNTRHSLWHLKQCNRTDSISVAVVRNIVSCCVYVSREGGIPVIGGPINDREKE